MTKDRRYISVKNLISGGHIKCFREIFDTIPKSIVYKDLGMNNERFTNLMFNVNLFLLNDLFRIADLIGTDKKNILDIVYNQFVEDEKSNIKSKRKSLFKKK